MPLYPSPGGYDVRLADLEARIRDQESGASLGVSAIQEGALVVLDAFDIERARLGDLGDGTYGFRGRVDGSSISGSTIDGGTITGGTITGVTISGSTILIMSGPTIVARLDNDGLWLTDPATGALVLIGAHIFGSKTNTGGSSQSGTQPANSSSGWQDLPGTQPVISSTTGKFLVESSANMGFVGTGNSANLQIRSGLVANPGGDLYVGRVITMPGGLTSMAQQLTMSRSSLITTTRGTDFYVVHQYKVQSGIGSASDWVINDYQTTATPA